MSAMLHTSDDSLCKFSALLKTIVDGDVTTLMEGQFQSMFAHMREHANGTLA